jgi:hypothetical protein
VKTNLGHVSACDGVGDVWVRGAVMTGKCRSYLWVSLKRVSCTLSWMQLFLSPFNSLLFFILLLFLSRE